MSSILKIIAYAFLIIGIAYVIPGISVAGFWPTAVIVGLGFALANALIRAIFSSSNMIFAIIALVLNGAAIWLLGHYVNGFDVTGFVFQGTALSSHITALVGAIIASLGVYLINEIL
ncbi:phage holin family protein [Candidatus Nomurabacteria bacterium]|nr:phage holin family protein [Candidatus Nomurabacteria bacterium]